MWFAKRPPCPPWQLAIRNASHFLRLLSFKSIIIINYVRTADKKKERQTKKNTKMEKKNKVKEESGTENGMPAYLNVSVS